jgi:hypothetical protein
VLVGEGARKVVLDNIVRATPIISAVYAYKWCPEEQQDLVLAIHFISDDGLKSSVLEKLSKKAHEDFVLTYFEERPGGLKDVVWRYSGSTRSVPDKAQLLYQRLDPILLDFDIDWEEEVQEDIDLSDLEELPELDEEILV